MVKSSIETDILVIGGSLTGLAAGLFLENLGYQTTIALGPGRKHDARTTALLSGSVDFFRSLDLWAALEPHAFPLKTMRIADGTKRLLRAPQVDFHASEIGLDAFGFNLANEPLLDVMHDRLKSSGKSSLIHGSVAAISETGIGYHVDIDGDPDLKNIKARFLVGADGRNSVVRSFMQVGENRWAYPQTALVLDFEHQYSSNYTSTEFHTETGPFTLVPQSDMKAGLVWLDVPYSAEVNRQKKPGELALVIEEKMGSFLGKIKISGPVQTFPISGMTASCFGKGNCVLIGEAAHVFPPVGAQGFNLGIRDIEALSAVIEKRGSENLDAGSEYHRSRMADVMSRTRGVDFMNRTLLSDFLPFQMIRTAGMYTLGNLPAFRRFAMRLGISPNLAQGS